MPRKRYQAEEIILKLREAEVLPGQGKNVAEACRQIGVTEKRDPDNTYDRWRKEYGGIRTDQAKRLKELERANARLKKLVAEAEPRLVREMVQLAEQYGRYGYRRVTE